MMTKFSIFFTLTFLFSAFSAYAQQQIHDISGNNITILSDVNNNTIKGSPYINEQFLMVKINDSETLFSARLNGHTGEMEVIRDEGEHPIALDVNHNYTVTFVQSKKSYKAFDVLVNGEEREKLFLLIDYNLKDITLLVKENVKFNEEKKSKTGYDKAKPASYERDEDIYFLKMGDNDVINVPRKSKDLAELFPQYEDSIKNFIKEEKIRTKDKNDLIKFINYVSTLK